MEAIKTLHKEEGNSRERPNINSDRDIFTKYGDGLEIEFRRMKLKPGMPLEEVAKVGNILIEDGYEELVYSVEGNIMKSITSLTDKFCEPAMRCTVTTKLNHYNPETGKFEGIPIPDKPGHYNTPSDVQSVENGDFLWIKWQAYSARRFADIAGI